MNKPRDIGAKARIAKRLVSSRGPLNRLKARRYGLDMLIGRKPVLELYYEPGDPHSHLAAQLLPLLAERSQVQMRVRIVTDHDPLLYPEPDRQRGFALADATRIAPAYGLQLAADAQIPDDTQRQRAACLLLPVEDDLDAFMERESELADALFAGNVTALEKLEARWSPLAPDAAANQLQRNFSRRARLGHYLPGMWQFNGDWFWGVDRMQYLQAALQDHGLMDAGPALVTLEPGAVRIDAPATPPEQIEFFFSFRSPYSYLAALAMRERLPDLPLPLQVRPVLPMAMRGFKIPPAKRLYIPRDVKREADRLGIPFGLVADPIGSGAERLLNTFPLADGTAQQLDFLCAASTTVWAEGIDVATDPGLQYVCEQAGIDWATARQRLATPDLGYAETNREALFAAGLWGVPCWKIGDFTTWGRDRIWLVDEYLRRFSG